VPLPPSTASGPINTKIPAKPTINPSTVPVWRRSCRIQTWAKSIVNKGVEALIMPALALSICGAARAVRTLESQPFVIPSTTIGTRWSRDSPKRCPMMGKSAARAMAPILPRKAAKAKGGTVVTLSQINK